MILRAIDPEEACCWRCGAWLPGLEYGSGYDSGSGDGYGYGDGDGWASGDGWGNGSGNGYGNDGDGRGGGWGALLPLCDDVLACAIRQAGETFFDQPPVRSTGE